MYMKILRAKAVMVTCLCISGYQLCDNSVGVLFNDYTRLIMYADGDSLQYIDKTAAESYLNVRSYPATLNKKVGNLFLTCSFISVNRLLYSFSFWPADNAAEIFPQLHERAPAEGRRQHRAAGRRRAGEAALSVPLVQNQERHCPAPEQRHRPDQLLPGELSIQTCLLRLKEKYMLR